MFGENVTSLGSASGNASILVTLQKSGYRNINTDPYCLYPSLSLLDHFDVEVRVLYSKRRYPNGMAQSNRTEIVFYTPVPFV